MIEDYKKCDNPQSAIRNNPDCDITGLKQIV